MKFQYSTCCVNSTARAINAMVDDAREITWSTFAKHCDWQEWAKSMGYGRDCGLYLKDDWAVGFYKSKYLGRPCYYVRHSAIEYIWLPS